MLELIKFETRGRGSSFFLKIYFFIFGSAGLHCCVQALWLQ